MKIIEGISIARLKFFSTFSIRSKKVIRNAFNSLLVKIFSIVANLTLIAVSIDCVNAENYGLWITISSLITWINIFDLGLITSLRNKITEALTYHNWDVAQKYTSTTYAMLIILVVPLWLIFLFTHPLIDWQTIFNTSVPPEILQSIIFWVFTSFCLQFLLKPISSILAGDQKHFIDGIIVLISNLVCLTLIFIFKSHFVDSIYLLSLVLGLIPCVVLAGASFLLFEFKYKPLRPSISGIDFKYRKQLLGVGLKFFIIQMAGVIIFSSNNFIISHFLGNEHVTTFYIAFRYFSILTIFYSLINAPIWTAYTEAYTLNDWQWIRKVTRNANQLCSILVVVT
ncbi:MAG TPA: hypothetical protein VE467_12770, partial [Chryseolinea sp.]|nr:hypothetical protein [Chryseolinea sp.]